MKKNDCQGLHPSIQVNPAVPKRMTRIPTKSALLTAGSMLIGIGEFSNTMDVSDSHLCEFSLT